MCCDGEPTSVCFSPGRGHIVLAGMREGSVALWDLREPTDLHRTHTLGAQCNEYGGLCVLCVSVCACVPGHDFFAVNVYFVCKFRTVFGSLMDATSFAFNSCLSFTRLHVE
jgi:hypothetical protein